MPKRTLNNLTEMEIRSAKPGTRINYLNDGGGLYLIVSSETDSGSKLWRFRYTRSDGRENWLSLGAYPDVSLKEARAKRDDAKRTLARGIDPSEHRKIMKAVEAHRAENCFEIVTREWFVKNSSVWAPSHAVTVIRRLERDVFPWLGNRPVGEITAPEVLEVLRRIEDRGAVETAHRVKQVCGQVFRYAIATGRAERDPAADLRGALTPVKSQSLASVTDPRLIGGILRAFDAYEGSHIVRCALRLAPLVFVRPGELRHAEWSEFLGVSWMTDLGVSGAAEWRIPPEKMKMREKHIVPLSRQAVEVLSSLYPLTGRGRYLFPSIRTPERPMSNNTVNAALRRLGFDKETLTGHGFRSMASTLLHEQGWPSGMIERQLAHAERNSVKAAYNHAEYLTERRRMMQAWADYLDELKAAP